MDAFPAIHKQNSEIYTYTSSMKNINNIQNRYCYLGLNLMKLLNDIQSKIPVRVYYINILVHLTEIVSRM